MANREYDSPVIETCVALLEQSGKIHLLSLLLTISSVLALLFANLVGLQVSGWFIGLLAVPILGGLELIYAARIGFDLSLLRRLIQAKDDLAAALAEMDNSLLELNLIPPAKTGKPLIRRLQGCVRLFKIQSGLCIGQLMVITIVTVLQQL